MSILDQPDSLARIDSKSMKSLLESFPDQIAAAARAGHKLTMDVPRKTGMLVVTGLGGSAIGGDLARSIAGHHLRVPFIVNRDYDLPQFVDASSTVFACSYSGNTEETINAYQQARKAKASIVCITSGGQLEALAAKDSVPVIRVPAGLPPRAALGYSLMMLLAALQTMNMIPAMAEAIQEALALLSDLREEYRASNPAVSNPAKQLATSLNGKIIVVYGSNGITDAVAYRWRSQIEENAKNLASHHTLPEMNHNELVGWLYPKEMLQQIGVVFLRDKGDHPQTQRRFELTRELIAGKASAVHEVWSKGDSLLARVLSIIYMGDFVSLYLAYLNNIDPTPVHVIESFKSKLSMPRTSSI
jgi:glucose/mannose-6-phosphate isomerase